MKHTTTAAAILCAAFAHTALANLQIEFVESAPKDSFVIKNIGACDLTGLEVEIDLSNSAGQLYFDTTKNGAGVEVFQAFEIRSGNLQLLSSERVSDGDTRLSVRLSELAAASSASFTIDVDDNLKNSSLGQIRVTGSELSGAQVRVKGAQQSALSSATFGTDNTVVVNVSDCG